MGCGHGRRQRGAGGRAPPWIFKYGTNIVDRGLKVLFFDLFLLFFDLFFIWPPPPGKFSADAFGCGHPLGKFGQIETILSKICTNYKNIFGQI